LLATDASRAAIVAAEQAADGVVSDADLAAVYSAAYTAHVRMCLSCQSGRDLDADDPFVQVAQQRINAAWAATHIAFKDVARVASSAPIFTAKALTPEYCPPAKGVAERRRLLQEWAAPDAASLRCIIANPFRLPPAIDPTWLAWNEGIVKRLAEAAYQERDLPSCHLDTARLSVLADALTDAGCTDTDLLDHLRSAGPHVRGCWAIDLLSGRK
jgi:hypothetical protein